MTAPLDFGALYGFLIVISQVRMYKSPSLHDHNKSDYSLGFLFAVRATLR